MASLLVLMELNHDVLYTNTAYLDPEENFLLKSLFASISRAATYIHSFNRLQLAIPVVLKNPPNYFHY